MVSVVSRSSPRPRKDPHHGPASPRHAALETTKPEVATSVEQRRRSWNSKFMLPDTRKAGNIALDLRRALFISQTWGSFWVVLKTLRQLLWIVRVNKHV